MAEPKQLFDLVASVRTSDLQYAQMWPSALRHPCLVEARLAGLRSEPEGVELEAFVQVRATGLDQAYGIVRQMLATSPVEFLDVRLDDTLDDDLVPTKLEDFQSSLGVVPWHRSESSGSILKVVWFTGEDPLERIDVEETLDRVTVTLWERQPPAFAADGTPIGSTLAGRLRCVEVQLSDPVADRTVYDGATGQPPASIRPGNYGERGYRSEALHAEIEALPRAHPPER